MNNLETLSLIELSMTDKVKKITLLTAVCLALAILNGYFFNFINDKFFHFTSDENGLAHLPIEAKLAIIVFLAPIIETVIFQFIPIEILKNTKLRNPVFLILIPSLIFAGAHWYHFIYIIMAFVGGIILNYYYVETQKISKYSFLLVVLLHSLYNLYGFIFVV